MSDKKGPHCDYCTHPDNDCCFPDCMGGWEKICKSQSATIKALQEENERLKRHSKERESRLKQRINKYASRMADQQDENDVLEDRVKELEASQHGSDLALDYQCDKCERFFHENDIGNDLCSKCTALTNKQER